MKLKKRTRRDKSYEIEGVYTERPVFDLLDQLELEHFRLSNSITTAERDQLLQELQIPVLLCDPTNSIYPRSQQIETIRRKLEKDRAGPICFQCKTSTRFKNSGQCFYCRNKFCQSCMHSNQVPIPEYCWDKPSPVCESCFQTIKSQRLYLPIIRNLSLSQDQKLALYRERARFLANIQKSSLSNISKNFNVSHLSLPVSNFPEAGILYNVVRSPFSPFSSHLLSSIPLSPSFPLLFHRFLPYASICSRRE